MGHKWVRQFLALAGGLCLAGSLTRAAEAPRGNLVRNPGFEEGTPGGDPAAWGKQSEGGAEGTVALTDGEAHSGRFSLLIQHTNEAGYIHPNHDLTVPPGVYAYRVWARSDADIPFRMEIYDTRAWAVGARPPDLQVGGATGQDFPLRKGVWLRCEMVVTATAPFPASLQIGLRRPGKLWLDDVELVPIEPLLVVADMGGPHGEPLGAEELARRPGWRTLTDRDAPFSGDLWLGTRYVGVALRRGAPAAEYYAAMPDGQWRKLSELTPVGAGGQRAVAIRSLRIHECYPDEAVVEAAFATAAGSPVMVRFRALQNQPVIETEPRQGTEALVASCVSRFAVVPDWFGGDLVVNAARTPGERLRIPRENLLLQMIEEGDAILAFVWLSPDQDVAVSLSGEGSQRTVTATELGYRWDQRGSVWVGAIAAPAVWRQKPIAELKDMKGNKVGGDLPFPAVWRIDFRRREDGLIDPWVPTWRRPDGNWEYCRDNGSRTMWTSCRDDLLCPAFLQENGLYLVNTRFANAMRHTFFPGASDLTFDPEDVALVYPYERTGATPADVYLVNDILQQALARTPAFQLYSRTAPVPMPSHRYPATCAVTAEYEKAFEEKTEKSQRRRLLQELRRMDYFVTTKRERVEEYMAWMRRQQEWLETQRKAVPAVAPLADRFAAFLDRMNQCYTKDRGPYMKTTADAMALVDAVEALIDSPEGEDKLARARDLGKQTRSIGGAQDAMVGYLRQIAKELRQTAGYAMLHSRNDAEFAFAREMRQRTMEMLWQTNGHEWR